MILDEIAGKTKERVAKLKEITTMEELEKKAFSMEINNDFPFEKALSKKGLSFICEVKKASPSKGVIAENFPYLEIAKDYENAGADAISCLTEPFYFKGSNDYLKDIAKEVKIPVLRKDFTVDRYMVYEAKIMGASAILLICAILTEAEIKNIQNLQENLVCRCLLRHIRKKKLKHP